MVDLKASGLQIVSSIIGSSLLVFAITTFYSDFFNKPNVSARIIPNINSSSIELANNGRVPANNLILTVQSPENIVDYEIFTTENRTIMVEEDNQTLVAKLPRFVHGDGSLISIEIFSAAEQESDSFNQNYVVYATYDEGSLKITSQKQRVTSSVPYGMTIALTISALLTFAIPYFYRRAKRNREHQYNKLVSHIIRHVSYVKRYLEKDPTNLPLQLMNSIAFIVRDLNDVKSAFKNKADFQAVYDFYKELVRCLTESTENVGDRYTFRQGESSQKNLEHIKEIAEKTLSIIRWEEYDVNIWQVLSRADDNPRSLSDPVRAFRRFNIAIGILQPMLAILVIPIVLSIGSYARSGDPLDWIQRFEIYHWALFVGAVILGIIIFFSRYFSDLLLRLLDIEKSLVKLLSTGSIVGQAFRELEDRLGK